MTRCKGCGKEFRKGVLAFLLTPKGMTGARVCQACASGGALIVAPTLAPVVKQKTVRSDGVERAIRQIHVLMRGVNTAGSDDYMRGRYQGLEASIEVLKRECGQ